MLNFFYMYAIVWSVILLFYSFGWSDICTRLAPELFVFFVSTILISVVMGTIYKKRFKGIKYEVSNSRSRVPVLIVIVFCILEFVYCRQIPLIHIVLRGGGYTEYTGIPTLHPLIISYGSFYAQYLFYRFLVNRSDKKSLTDYILILLFIYLLQFNRGGLMISVFMSVFMFLGINSDKIKNKMNKRSIFLSIIALLIVLFLFGALGNIRHGFSIANSSYIQRLGRFNDSYPSWLPKQFMWAYIYIVSPIANINYNVNLHFSRTNIPGYIMTFFPDFISRRIYTGSIYSPKLVIEHVFNATAGFGTAYMNAGIVGMYFLYFYLMFGLTFLWRVVPVRNEYKMPCLAIMNIIVIFMFFTHTIYYSAISFQIVFPLLSFVRFKISSRTLL